MEPTSQIFPGRNIAHETAAGEGYVNLPYYKQNDFVITRWKATWKDRLRVLFGGSLWLYIITGNSPIQPVLIKSDAPRWDE